MSAVLKPIFTLAEYLAHEQVAIHKSEFYRGQIFAMSGGSPNHNAICVNLIISLGIRLRGSSCRPCHSDQRIRIPATGLSTYPDVSIYCGEMQLDCEDRNAMINPCVIVEVLSKSTESYDRGKKFDLYRGLESLREYILISQEEPQIERYVLQENDTWNFRVLKGLDATLPLQLTNIEVPFSEIYEGIVFQPEEFGKK